jgi:hypothetical protein
MNLYKKNVNSAADVPHTGRRCQYQLKLRGSTLSKGKNVMKDRFRG